MICMQLTLRLYYPEDADLIALRLKYGRKFTLRIRECLLACACGAAESYQLIVPPDICRYFRAPDAPVVLNLNLKAGRDDEILGFLQTIKPSSRCGVVKSLFRFCFDADIRSLYIANITGDAKVVKGRKYNKSSVVGRNKMHSISDLPTEELQRKEQKEITPAAAGPDNAEPVVVPAVTAGIQKPDAEPPLSLGEELPGSEDGLDVYDMFSSMLDEE